MKDHEDITANQFASFFSTGVDILGLDDRAIAEMFSASRPTAEKWRHGASVPTPALRVLIVRRLASEIVAKFDSEILEDAVGFCSEPIDTETLQAILKL